MHEDLKTPLAVYSKGFKSAAPTSDINYFMTLEEYLDKYYKPRTYLSYDEWINKQCDNDGDGKVGASSSKLTVRNAEKRQKKKLLQDPTTYSKWEAYVQTTRKHADWRLNGKHHDIMKLYRRTLAKMLLMITILALASPPDMTKMQSWLNRTPPSSAP